MPGWDSGYVLRSARSLLLTASGQQKDSNVSQQRNTSPLQTSKLTTLEQFSNMIALNNTALTALSKAALMLFQKKNTGSIVNIGSGVGFAPLPMVPVYGPTKAYVMQFTQILQPQVAGTGIRVQLVTPGAVLSEGWDVAGALILTP